MQQRLHTLVHFVVAAGFGCALLTPLCTVPARADDATAEAAPAATAPAVDAADGSASGGATSDPAGEAGKPDRIGDGGRVTVRDGDFSIQAPKGWEVYEHLPSLTLLMQVPHEEGAKYQRTIQVASFAGNRFIDEVTSREYEDVITRKFSSTSAAIEGYRIRNHLTIEMTDGRPGLLFYSEFTLDGVSLMQAHVLVSSQKRHYLVTYTDLAEHFENEGANQYLSEAWDAMISTQLGSATPVRFAGVAYAAFAAGVVTLFSVLLIGYRRWRVGRSFRDYADGDSESGGEERDGDGDGDGDGDVSRDVSRVQTKKKKSGKGKDNMRKSAGDRRRPERSSPGLSATSKLASSVDARSIAAQSLDSRSVDAASLDARSLDARSLDARTMQDESQPAQSLPSQAASAMSASGLGTLDQATLHPEPRAMRKHQVLPKAKAAGKPGKSSSQQLKSRSQAKPSNLSAVDDAADEDEDPLTDSDDFAI